MESIFLKPGELSVATTPTLFRTILGSCVAVCVFDRRQKIGGINHFLLWNQGNQDQSMADKDLNRYGEYAVVNLLKLFKKKFHSQKEDLIVKIIGGSESSGEKLDSIGKNNFEQAKVAIEKLGLKIASVHVGGTQGRKVEFNSYNGEVRVKLIEKSAVNHTDSHQSNLKSKCFEDNSKIINVLIVDDSKPIRMIIKKLIESSPLMKVVGEANHPLEAKEVMKKNSVDLITLDINMPFMDGVTYLESLMKESPVPVIMVTDYRLDQSGPVLKSLELGAFDYINKAELPTFLENPAPFIEIIKTAYCSKSQILNRKIKQNSFLSTPSSTIFNIPQYLLSQYVILIGASTGGTEAIKEVLTRLPKEIPPILCVQHIPPVFSKAFADRLNELCPFEVKEAENYDQIIPGRVLIAPGGLQMKIEKNGDGYKVALKDDPPVNRFKPSVDYLFDSAHVLDKKIVAVLMTGMGEDGAKGLLNLKNLKKAKTIAQDQESSIVFGMPKAAIEIGAAEQISPLDFIAINILKKIV